MKALAIIRDVLITVGILWLSGELFWRAMT